MLRRSEPDTKVCDTVRLSGISQAASSFLPPVRCSDGRTRRVGDQRRCAHGASAAWNGIVCWISNPHLLDGDRNCLRQRPRFSDSQHHAAGDVHSGLAENVTSTRHCTWQNPTGQRRGSDWVQTAKASSEHMFSGLAPIADMAARFMSTRLGKQRVRSTKLGGYCSHF